MIEPEFEKLYHDMDNHLLQPLWRAASSVMPTAPIPKTVPWIWKWSQLYSLARRSGELVTLARGGDRRALGLANPGLGGFSLRHSDAMGGRAMAERRRSSAGSSSFRAGSTIYD